MACRNIIQIGFATVILTLVALFLLRTIPLNWAILVGADSVAKLQLLVGADVNSGINNGRTPLIEGCISRNPEIVEFLISKGANINIKNDDRTALMTASARGCSRCVEILLSAGANVNEIDVVGATALTFAVMNDKIDVATTLLQAGADPNIPMKGGFTSLMTAVHHRNVPMASLLLSKGASVDLKGPFDKTAYDLAKDVEDERTRFSLLEEILRHSANK